MANVSAPSGEFLSAVVGAVGTAGNDLTTIIGRVQRKGVVAAVTYAPNADITGAATNNRRFDLINKGQDGNGTTVVASLAFGNGVNATDYDEKTITLSATPANLNVAEGDILAWASIHINTGITDPGGLVTVEIDSGTAGHSASGYVRGVA